MTTEQFKTSEHYKTIMKIVDAHRSIEGRETALREAGYKTTTAPMGSGGVRQVKEIKTKYRIQIGYGVGRHNYAPVVEIKK